MNSIYILITIFISFFLSACDSSNFTTQIDAEQRLVGVVVDGYISDASVCLDKNANNICDNNEITTKTDQNGIFNILTGEDTNSTKLIPIVAFDGLDTSTDKNFKDKIKNIIDFSKIENGSNIIISPLTDLVAVSYLNREVNSSDTLEEAKMSVADVLGVTKTDLNKDPMKDITLFAISQELQHSKFLIQTVCEKNLNHNVTELERISIQEDIKNEILNQNFNIERILIAMEINQNITIPENEKTFVINQLNELKTKLNALSHDTSLEIENLNRLQKSIDIIQTQANEKLLNAKEGETLDIIEINITAESITQSDFDTTDAILDENACLDSGFNVITNNSFEPEKSEDSKNGISLKSTYPFNKDKDLTEVTLYYPDLNQTKESDNVVVFGDNYYFAFDKAWTKNDKKTIYIRIPKKDENSTYSCYRYVLNFRVSTDVTPIKVYRYKEL